MTTTEAVAGVDLGTTTSKVLVRARDGRELARAEARTPWVTTAQGGTEISADAFAELAIQLLRRAFEQAEEAVGGVRVRAVGVAGLAESGVIVDRAGIPASPAIAWFDRRGERQVREVTARSAEFGREFVRRTGLPWDCQASIAKLLWLRDEGLTISSAHRWLNIPEYVVHRLGGQSISEPSLASRTGLLDQATLGPWVDGPQSLGLPSTLLNPLVSAGNSLGLLRSDLLPAGLQSAALTVAGHDHPVAAVGVGVTGADELFNSSGTADVLARSIPGPLTDDQRELLVGDGASAGAHVLPDTTLILAGVRGGLVLRRVLDLLGAGSDDRRDELDREALQLRGEPAGLGISGAGPTGDDVVLHVRDGASPAAVWAAAIRYTAHEAATVLQRVDAVVGPHDRAVACGGWTRMASVRRAKSEVIAHLEFSEVREPGVTGAAVLALQAAGLRSHQPEPVASHI
jgi:sugar (pentulose or hexulose) kinase